MLRENVYDRFPFSSVLILLFAVDILGMARVWCHVCYEWTGGSSAAARSVTNQHQSATTWVSNILPASYAPSYTGAPAPLPGSVRITLFCVPSSIVHIFSLVLSVFAIFSVPKSRSAAVPSPAQPDD